jgi:hypothetical protein
VYGRAVSLHALRPPVPMLAGAVGVRAAPFVVAAARLGSGAMVVLSKAMQYVAMVASGRLN